MRVILLSLMMVCLFGYHANACFNCDPMGPQPPQLNCHGFAEIRSEFNGTETVHGKMTLNEGEDLPKKASKMRYRMPGGRNAEVTIEDLPKKASKMRYRMP